ncbi:hypothetical protein LSM04_007804 [Trypanosoma melophagium]|uniref:uncharacterized protein n=1 Tax=Trypanosoma melophagium TaxID=715481 RepID=UPI003519EFD0|nr:hypothetical protein LSM04_007804 [Trypanosoma melophagium]
MGGSACRPRLEHIACASPTIDASNSRIMQDNNRNMHSQRGPTARGERRVVQISDAEIVVDKAPGVERTDFFIITSDGTRELAPPPTSGILANLEARQSTEIPFFDVVSSASDSSTELGTPPSAIGVKRAAINNNNREKQNGAKGEYYVDDIGRPAGITVQTRIRDQSASSATAVANTFKFNVSQDGVGKTPIPGSIAVKSPFAHTSDANKPVVSTTVSQMFSPSLREPGTGAKFMENVVTGENNSKSNNCRTRVRRIRRGQRYQKQAKEEEEEEEENKRMDGIKLNINGPQIDKVFESSCTPTKSLSLDFEC